MKLITEPVDLGNEIEILPHLNNSNKIIPMAYYLSGIDEVDDKLNEVSIHKFGIDFNIISLEKGVCFIFGDLWKGDKFYITRDRIMNIYNTDVVDIDVIPVNKFVQALKTGAFGQGFVGSLMSMGAGALIEKTATQKMTKAKGYQLQLGYEFYKGTDRYERLVVVEVPQEFGHSALDWFKRNWTRQTPTPKPQAEQSSNCFIAGVCYKDIYSKELFTFREFRDRYLRSKKIGIYFINTYYKVGPYIAKYLNNKKIITACIKKIILNPFYRQLKKRGY
jgi:hypothetical protein